MTTTQLFVPPLDSVWRFTEDWTPPASFAQYGNWNFFETYGATYARWSDIPARQGHETAEDYAARWRAHTAAEFAEHDIRFPAGTVVIFDRYHVSHSGSEEITLRVLASPDNRIHPRKLGGKGKGKLRFYVTIAQLNTFPRLEEAHVPT